MFKDQFNLKEELLKNAKEYKETPASEKVNTDELNLIDDIVNRALVLSKKGKTSFVFAVGRSTGYNVRKIRMELIKEILENEPYSLYVDIITPNSTTEVYMLHISAEDIIEIY